MGTFLSIPEIPLSLGHEALLPKVYTPGSDAQYDEQLIEEAKLTPTNKMLLRHLIQRIDERNWRSREIMIYMEETKIWKDLVAECNEKEGPNADDRCHKLRQVLAERTAYINSRYNPECAPTLSPALPFVPEAHELSRKKKQTQIEKEIRSELIKEIQYPCGPMKSIQKISNKELELGINPQSSWHQDYRDSAYIFIGGLSFDLTEGDVISVFSQYGEISDINLVRDKETGKSKGFCFLAYEDQRSTDLAVDNFNGIKILNKTIRVDHVKNYRNKKEDINEREDDLAAAQINHDDPLQKSEESKTQANNDNERNQVKTAAHIISFNPEDPMGEFLMQEEVKKQEKIEKLKMKQKKRMDAWKQEGKCDAEIKELEKLYQKCLKERLEKKLLKARTPVLTIKSERTFKIPNCISEKIGLNLHLKKGHPLNIVRSLITHSFGAKFESFSNKELGGPQISTIKNFDELYIEPNHPSRSISNTYYLSDSACLRTHTTAHEKEIIERGSNAFLISADVYRRDEIDSTHFPVFHQMEGVRIFSAEDFPSEDPTCQNSKFLPFASKNSVQEEHLTQLLLLNHVINDLKSNLNQMIKFLFGPKTLIEWGPDSFPFTFPSYEVKVQLPSNEMIEILGCGILKDSFLKNALKSKSKQIAWAFGIGLERVAMRLFDIPDIRLFWSADSRFTSQFMIYQDILDEMLANGKAFDHLPVPPKFVPFSKYPGISRDISFWLKVPDDQFLNNENQLFDQMRSFGGDLLENVKCIDQYKSSIGKISRTYRVYYSSMERSLTDNEVNFIHSQIREAISNEFADFLLLR